MHELKMEIVDTAGGIRVLRLTGPLTLNNLFDFQDAARAETDLPVVIDLSEVPYMDSAGLGAVLGILASCQRKTRGFGMVGASDRLKTLFDVAGVGGLIPSFDSMESAERKLSKTAAS